MQKSMRNGFLTLTLSLLLFLYGFIPWDSHQIKNDELNESVNRSTCGDNHQIPVSKLVLVVIDAWRLGFLTQKNSMPWMRGQFENGRADIFDVRVHTPTVTMPRIKALTSGTVPSFASVLLNFGGSNSSQDDTWLRAANEVNKKIVFYGDDTWLSLYSTEFLRSEGVVSFFVKDYTEVDNNVTRNIAIEFSKNNFPTWDIMILHYLGLDHIGHSLGGNAAEVDEKLLEMDRIVMEISQKLKEETSSYVILVVGDHGMTEAGGHGGSTHSETHVPLFLVNNQPKLPPSNDYNWEKLPEIDQVDIANLISNFLMIRLPHHSIGAPIENLMKSSEFASNFRQSWIYSAKLILKNLEKQNYKTENLKHCLELMEAREMNCEMNNKTEEINCTEEIREAQRHLILNSSSIRKMDILISAALIFWQILLLFRMVIRKHENRTSTEFRIFFVISVLNFTSYFSSSLVEEEHDFWSFFLSTAIFVEILSSLRRRFSGISTQEISSLILFAIIHRFCTSVYAEKRRRNLEIKGTYPNVQVEDPEWLTDIAVFSFSFIKSFIPMLLPMISSIFIGFDRKAKRFSRNPTIVLLFLFSLFGNTMLGSYMPIVWGFAAITFLFFRSSIGILLWTIALCRENEVPIVLLCFCLGWLSKDRQSLLVYLLPCSFFYLGNSNSLASVDIAAGYTGLTSYQTFIVGLQIVLHSYSGPIAVLCGYVSDPSKEIPLRSLRFSEDLSKLLLLSRLISLFGSFISLLVFSQHLFVWSVFAPKVLFEISHSIFFMLFYGLGCWIAALQ